jgi:hypothetical protein
LFDHGRIVEATGKHAMQIPLISLPAYDANLKVMAI